MFLPKYLAHCGVCSRRKAVDIVKNGDVKVNEKTVRDVTYVVKPTDQVKYKNRVVRLEEFKYILLNKPKGYVTTLSDERGRKTVIELIDTKILGRIYPVGRLDINTTGLLLLTNDGQLAQKLSHPKYEVLKKYNVVLDRLFLKKDFERLKKGIKLRDGFVKLDSVSYAKKDSQKNLVVQIHSGKNRIVRRIFEHLGYRIKKLDRVGFAGLTKKGLSIGQWKILGKKDVERLNLLRRSSGQASRRTVHPEQSRRTQRLC